MKSVSIWFLSLALVFGLSACNNRTDNVEAAGETDSTIDRGNTLTQDEKEFVEYAAEMHAGEIKLAEQAKQKSTNQAVKDYADEVIESQSAALERLADKMDLNRTRENTAPSRDTKGHAEYLSTLSGAQFDSEFIALMIADHQDAATTFQSELNAAQNPALKAFVKETLPALENNLKLGRDSQKRLTGTRAY